RVSDPQLAAVRLRPTLLAASGTTQAAGRRHRHGAAMLFAEDPPQWSGLSEPGRAARAACELDLTPWMRDHARCAMLTSNLPPGAASFGAATATRELAAMTSRVVERMDVAHVA